MRLNPGVSPFWARSSNHWVKLLFHSIGRLIGLGPDARGGCPTPQKWSEKILSNGSQMLSQMPKHPSPRDKMSPTGLGHPVHQPIKLSSTDHLVTLTRSRSHTKIIGEENLFHFSTVFIWLTAWSCTGKRGNTQWKNWIADWVSFEIMSKKGCRFREHRFSTIDWVQSDPGSCIQLIRFGVKRGLRIQGSTPNQRQAVSGPRRTGRLMEWKSTFILLTLGFIC